VAEDLSQQERDLIANLIRDGKPVPARYIPSIVDNPLVTELIWPGKTTFVDSIVLPFQSIEHIDEPRKGTSQQYDLFAMDTASGRQSGGWTNKLIWGDNKLILSSLVNGPLRKEIDDAGGLKFVYIDPPFDVGADFSINVEVGETSVTKKASVVEQVAYRDTWGAGKDSYANMISNRLRLIRDLMSDDGIVAVHVDWRITGLMRQLLDEVFGSDRFLNEIIWRYRRWPAPSRALQRMHDNILVYKAGEAQHSFHPEYEELSASSQKQWKGKKRTDNKSDEGTRFSTTGEEESKGALLSDVWEISQITAPFAEYVAYPTQKPEELLSRIMRIFTSPGDLVADFFCGSGTTLAVAEKLGRKWIGSDLGRFAIHTTRKRLISIQREASKGGQPFRSFEILNLGGYERLHLVGHDPHLDEASKQTQSLIRREEFVDLILSAYGAQKSGQLEPFSGTKGGTAIFIGAIDSAVTQDQVQRAIDTAISVGISRVDVLGFEFEMGISPAMSDSAKEQGLTLTVRYIPNEVFDKRAIAKGQVIFYEAGYVEANCVVTNKTLQVTLTDFGVFYRQDDADETAAELRNGASKVVVDQGQVVRVAKDKKGVITKENLTSNWQDWIDYWAVDFDFASQPETITVLKDGKEVKQRTGKFIFENEWQSFRTKSDRSLELTSSPFSYADPGNYSVAVKLIDIFGNDTTRVFKIKVK
jgi:adenine-specific DNA-methyltransferase